MGGGWHIWEEEGKKEKKPEDSLEGFPFLATGLGAMITIDSDWPYWVNYHNKPRIKRPDGDPEACSSLNPLP